MQKIRDRFIAGVIAGLIANLPKQAIEWTAYSLGIAKEVGSEKAAGFFLPRSQVKTPMGRFIGIVSDHIVAAGLGLFDVYLMTFTGGDYPVLKGIACGHATWGAAYGVMSVMARKRK